MRVPVIWVAAFLVGCGAPPPGDRTADPHYAEAVERLASMARDANSAYAGGKYDDAAAIIEKAQPVMKQVLGVPHPALAAEQACSEIDDLYARMLLRNRHYEWAMMLFQQNRSRWKHWTPQTPDTERRLKQAEDGIAECERKMTQ